MSEKMSWLKRNLGLTPSVGYTFYLAVSKQTGSITIKYLYECGDGVDNKQSVNFQNRSDENRRR